MKKNILLISIYYPPILSIASNRIESFSKYLDKEKYNVYVHTLTADKTYIPPEGVIVNRVANDVLFKPLFFTKRTNKLIHYSKVIYNKALKYFFEDEYRGWITESLRVLPDFIKENNIDVIISTYSPSAPHIVTLELKKQFPHLKWIADMRDEMSRGIELTATLQKRYEKIEQEIFTHAEALTTVSKSLVEEFYLMSRDNSILFRQIRNGYDFDIQEVKTNTPFFTITYTGSFYEERRPNNFLQALNNIVARDSSKKINVRLVGVKTHFEIPELLQDMIDIIPSVSHDRAIEMMRESDALLLIHDATNGRKVPFQGKLFEYLASLRTIIALINENDASARLIRDANAGYIANNKNIQKIEMIIEEAYREWKEKRIRKFNLNVIKKHHRKEQAKRLEKVIDEIFDER